MLYKTEKRGTYPNLSLRIQDPDRQKKIAEMKAANVDISETFRPVAYEAIDAAYEKFLKSR